MSTFVFPGQGSQKVGMGSELFELYPNIVEQANEVLGYDVKTLCLNDPEQRLHQTQYTQPALYVVNALSYLNKRDQEGKTPDCVAGHSLGEYNALFAAGVFDFATGLRLVQQRGSLMSQATEGSMAAIIGLQEPEVMAVVSTQEGITIANYNSHTQFVISGPKHAVAHALPLFETAGAAMVIPLNVSGAFHSPLMSEAAQQFKTFLQAFSFDEPQIAVIANITARPYESADCVRDYLSQQMVSSVRWTDSIMYLLQQGETEFTEVGPGAVLTGLIRRIKTGSKTAPE